MLTGLQLRGNNLTWPMQTVFCSFIVSRDKTKMQPNDLLSMPKATDYIKFFIVLQDMKEL